MLGNREVTLGLRELENLLQAKKSIRNGLCARQWLLPTGNSQTVAQKARRLHKSLCKALLIESVRGGSRSLAEPARVAEKAWDVTDEYIGELRPACGTSPERLPS